MKYHFLITILLILSASIFAQDYDLRKVKWGMSHRKVIKIEKLQGNELQYFESDANLPFMSCNDCFKIGEYSTRLTYTFTHESDKLFKANIEILEVHYTEDIEACNYIYALLEKKFDKPGKKYFAGDKMPDGKIAENVFYIWEKERTVIIFEHPYVGFKNFSIRYLSKEYMNISETELNELLKGEDKKSKAAELEKKKELKELDQL